jgi:hypothetical protein
LYDPELAIRRLGRRQAAVPRQDDGIDDVRPSRSPLRGLLRMRNVLSAIPRRGVTSGNARIEKAALLGYPGVPLAGLRTTS